MADQSALPSATRGPGDPLDPAADWGAIRATLGPGLAVVLIPPERLRSLQREFEAVGGKGDLNQGTAGVVLLFRDAGRGADGVELPLAGLAMEIEGQRWNLDLVQEAGWGSPHTSAVAMLRLTAPDSLAKVSGGGARVLLLGEGPDAIGELPASWSAVVTADCQSTAKER